MTAQNNVMCVGLIIAASALLLVKIKEDQKQSEIEEQKEYYEESYKLLFSQSYNYPDTHPNINKKLHVDSYERVVQDSAYAPTHKMNENYRAREVDSDDQVMDFVDPIIEPEGNEYNLLFDRDVTDPNTWIQNFKTSKRVNNRSMYGNKIIGDVHIEPLQNDMWGTDDAHTDDLGTGYLKEYLTR